MATKNNWFTTNLSERSPENLCNFDVIIKPYEFETGIFLDNAKRVAKELSDIHGRLYLGYSGGLDSEFVLKTFHEQGLPITPILIDTPFNQLELAWAYNYCKENNIKPEILSYSKNEIIDKLKEKTIDKGFYSLLGGLPLIICDEVNKLGAKSITGYGEPFTTIPGKQPNHKISTRLEFAEWDYYLDVYDNSHVSGFFTYDLGLFHSLIQQISYGVSTQSAKYNLYQVTPRQKMFWQEEFYVIFREMRLQFDMEHNHYIQKRDLIREINKYKKD